MATAEDIRELTSKVSALVRRRYGGSWPAAFAFYDKDGDGRITEGELVQLLADADVGNSITRGSWAEGVIEEIGGPDSRISFLELQSILPAAQPGASSSTRATSSTSSRPDYLFPTYQTPAGNRPPVAPPRRKPPPEPRTNSSTTLKVGAGVLVGWLALRAFRRRGR